MPFIGRIVVIRHPVMPVPPTTNIKTIASVSYVGAQVSKVSGVTPAAISKISTLQ